MMHGSYKTSTTTFFMLIHSCMIYTNPFYDFRSQSVNLARDLAGLQTFLGSCDDDHSMRGFVALTPAYTQSFRADKIAACLFGNSVNTDCTPSVIKIEGSLVTRRDPQA